jgi:hypothetical protein
MPLEQKEEKDTTIFWSVLAWGLLLQPNLRTYFRGVILPDVTGNHKPNIKSYTTDELQFRGPTTGRTAHRFPRYAGWANTGLGSFRETVASHQQQHAWYSQTNGCTAVSKYAFSGHCSGCYIDVADVWSGLYTWTCIQRQLGRHDRP